MSERGLQLALDRMVEAGVHQVARDTFALHYRELEQGATGVVPEETISPLESPAQLADVEADAALRAQALAQTAVLKLNGGLGTSMGMSRAKSLLPVRDDLTFLDVVVRQVLALRERTGSALPLVFMNSFSTREDTLHHLRLYPELQVHDLPLDVLQSQEPKLRTEDLTPVRWDPEPRLEWCPPGHGDLYPTLLGSGLLDRFLEAGMRYLFVSNIDNLGAAPDGRVAAWFAASGAGYAAEVCRRTPMDRKGGHLARRRTDGRLILRETAQTAPEEMHFFTDETRHPWVHTNNLWFDLARLREVLRERGGVMPLPVIRNEKTVDPTDAGSTPVIQIETAMGSAIELFDDSIALGVTRERFQPVKTTNELLLLRSDVYDLSPDYRLRQVPDRAPIVSLAKAHYGYVRDFEARFPHGAPSLREATAFSVEGDWTFGEDVVVRGETCLGEEGGRVADGSVLGD